MGIDLLNHVAEDEVFRLFAMKLFDRLDTMSQLLEENKKQLDMQSKMLEAQSEKIDKMTSAFDRIMGDYFKDVAHGIKEFSKYAETQASKNDVVNIAEATPQVLKMRLDHLKDKVNLVDKNRVKLSSPEMQELYDELIPSIKRQLSIVEESLYGKILADFEKLAGALSANSVEIGEFIRKNIVAVNNNMNSKVTAILAKIAESEKSIKMSIPGGSRNTYRD